ncbi:hypothetical protein PS9374_07195 [Planomonospora sphaerica]|uniref:Uncharacterized protein n=1 Tax=Planomonospora sphaerica TaxID=161355 RepID=A0A161MFZ1_9ACTN|nr:hypothetical protein PS9374_07195 [Planomonospora sphaerica]
MPQHRRHLSPHQLQQHPAPLGLRQPRQPPLQLPAGRTRTRPRRLPHRHPHQTAQQRGKVVAPAAQGRTVDLDGRQHGLVREDGRVEQGQALPHRDGGQAQPPHPLFGLVQEVAQAGAGGPEAVGDGGGRQALGPAVRRQPVQEHVRRRVVALTRRQHHPARRGEQHERRQIQLRRQLVQIPRRIRLRPEHRIDPLRRQRAHQPVVRHPGRVHHTPQRMLHRNRRQQIRQRFPVGHVTRRHRHPRPQRGQLGGQLHRTRRLQPPPTGQHQMPHPVLDHQMPRHQRTQTTRAAGHQHRAVRIPDGALVRLGDHRPGQARQPDPPGPDRRLRLAGGGHRPQRLTGLGHAVGVDQHEPARVLRLRRPHQTPHRGQPHVQILTRQRHRAPGHHHQAGVREPLVGQPRLHHRQHLGGGRPHALGHVRLGHRALEHHRPGHRTALGHLPPGRPRHRAGGGGRGLDPLDPEQRVVMRRRRGAQLLGRDGAAHQRLHRQHGSAFGVRHRQ